MTEITTNIVAAKTYHMTKYNRCAAAARASNGLHHHQVSCTKKQNSLCSAIFKPDSFLFPYLPCATCVGNRNAIPLDESDRTFNQLLLLWKMAVFCIWNNILARDGHPHSETPRVMEIGWNGVRYPCSNQTPRSCLFRVVLYQLCTLALDVDLRGS